MTSTFYSPIIYDDIIIHTSTQGGGPPADCWEDKGTYIFVPDGCVYEILSGEVG